MSTTIAIVVAAGSSTRTGAIVPKQFLELGGQTVCARAVAALLACPGIGEAIVVIPAAEVGGARDAALRSLGGVRAVVAGGPTRAHSVLAGVEAALGADLVLVHDAARPFVSPQLVASVLEATSRVGAAAPAIRVPDTIKREEDGFVAETIDRQPLRLAQTPQGARRDWLLEALRRALDEGATVTDEAQALERAGRRVALVPGEIENVKITTASDWRDAQRRLDENPARFRVGHGFDIHRFGTARRLVLGGVVFPGQPGLDGHSDADVVLHAAMDAVLGAAGLPDIGYYFPPSDPRFAGADSKALAKEVSGHVAAAGFRIVNIDLTILAEHPRIQDHAEAMRAAIAASFSMEPLRIGLKATTLEGLGALGRGEGIACHAMALLASATGGR